MFRFENERPGLRAGVFVVAAFAALAAGCGQRTDLGAGDGTEVAAKVNGDDVTVGQIQAALQAGTQRNVRVDAGDAMTRLTLDRLINQQIVVQKAVAAKLDRDPEVLAQIEQARREILVRRFVEKAAEAAAKPTDEQVRQFYDSRPAMFADRRVYTLARADIVVPDDRRAEVETHVRSLKSMGELTDWLKTQNLHFTTRQEQAAAEQMPAPMLERVASLKEGESAVLPTPAGVSAVTLLSAVPAPRTLADARPAIEAFLSGQGRRQFVVDLQKTLRDDARIQYLGRFAASASAVGGQPAAAPSHPAAPAASSAAPAASQNPPAQR